jgi:hypothetical protein
MLDARFAKGKNDGGTCAPPSSPDGLPSTVGVARLD